MGLHFCDILTHLFVLAYLLRDQVGWSIFGLLWVGHIAFGILVGTMTKITLIDQVGFILFVLHNKTIS